MNCIVSCSIPVSVADNEDFVRFLEHLDPKFKLPSRYQIVQKHLPQLTDQVISAAATKLQAAKHVCLTMDIWTDRRTHAFLGVTAHTFVDYVPDTVLLAFDSKGSHTGIKIAEKIEQILVQNKLLVKVSAIVCDNASNMKKAIEVLDELALGESSDAAVPNTVATEAVPVDDESLWEDMSEADLANVDAVLRGHHIERVSCFAHSIQLVVKEGLACIKSSTVLSKCSALATLVHHSPV